MRRIHLLFGVSVAAIVIAGEAAAQTDQTVHSLSGVAQLEELVVTASRRNESIREVPTAVSAYGEEKLRDGQVANLEGLTAMTPNIQISTYLTNANIAIRGIGAGNLIQAGGEPGVAVHENGVYLGQSGLAVSTLLDTQRVEILRGPQGTLFGRNATGGAINIIPNAPSPELAYGFDLSAGLDPTMVRSSAYLSGPVDEAGTVLGRLSLG